MQVISGRVTHRKSNLMLFLLALACASIGGSASGYQRPIQIQQKSVESKPVRGLRITRVYENSLAQKAGLQSMDVILRYGEVEMVDEAAFFTARDTYEKSGEVSVDVVVWRGNEKIAVRVPAGRLGMDTTDHNPVSYAFNSLMEKANVLLFTPEFMRDSQFKEAASPEKILEEARRLIDRAAQVGTLTPTQVLVARIYLTLDNAPPEDIKKQSELLAQLLSTQPDSYINMLGQALFFQKKRYRAAIECLTSHLKVAPSDVSARLNLGNALGHLERFDEAEFAADYVLDHKLGLSKHGFVVAYQVKAMAALGHHDYQKAISFAEKSFTLNPTTFDLFLWQLAAAQTGDLQKIAEVSRKFEEVLPEDYQQLRFQVDAVTAYALIKNDQRDEARELVTKWRSIDRVESKVNAYWAMYPGGSDVVKSWKDLMSN